MLSIKKLVPFFSIFLFGFQNTYAQLYSEDTYFADIWLKKEKMTDGFPNSGYVLLKATGQFNSNAVTNDFITKQLYSQETASEADAKYSVSRLKDYNTAGLDANASLSSAFSISKTLQIDAGIGYRDFSSLYFTRDLFKLVFENYEQYADKDAKIGPSNMREYNYGSIFLGAQKAVSQHFILGARLKLIKAGSFQEVNIEEGNVHYSDNFINPYAELSAPFQYYSQERQMNPFAADNGWGGGIDLYTHFCLDNALFTAEVRDLGFINWKNADAYVGNKTYKYSGADFIDLFTPNNIGDPSPDDVAKQMGIPKQQVNRRNSLPTKVQLGYLQKLSKYFALQTNANYILMPGYKPYGKVAAYIYPAPAFFIAPAVVAGGYGLINSQLGLGVTVAETWTVQLNVMALEYLLARKTYSGHGLDFMLAKSFK